MNRIVKNPQPGMNRVVIAVSGRFPGTGLTALHAAPGRGSRELLYTGLTRARSQVLVCGHADVWKAGVRNPVERHSGLEERLFEARK